MRYTVGLDIGIASVGWCVLNHDCPRIEALGVRTFNPAENPKTGESPAKPRRDARSVRRRLHRRRKRLDLLITLFIKYCLISENQKKLLISPPGRRKDPWTLRAEGLNRLLTKEEWARVLYHICKHRGYRSMRLDERGKDTEEGLLKTAIAENKAYLREKGWRTAGEMIAWDSRFFLRKRNHDDYQNAISREMIDHEIKTLFQKQRVYKSAYADESLQNEFLALFHWQAPIQEGDEILQKVKYCTLESSKEKGAPKAGFHAERFILLQKINNIRLICEGEKRCLSEDERQQILALVYQVEEVTYLRIRKELGLLEKERFVGVKYSYSEPPDNCEKKTKFIPARFWHTLRKTIQKISNEAWDSLSSKKELLDEIGLILTVYKMEDSVRKRLTDIGLEHEIIEALIPLRYRGFLHISLKALKNLIPFLEKGNSYSEACLAAGYDPAGWKRGEKQFKLPPIPKEDIRNPAVLRSLSQARKVLNAIIQRYGTPEAVHIELAREMGKPKSDREQIERKQEENRLLNEQTDKELQEMFNIIPSRDDRIKYRLYSEQNGCCIYCGSYLDPKRTMVEYGYAEVEHILPFSRSLDNSYLNKALACADCNRKKGRRTPREMLGDNTEEWDAFQTRLNTLQIHNVKKNNLLRKSLSEDESRELKERNLIDTRYITRYFYNYVQDNLILKGPKIDNVLPVNGRITAYLRARWCIKKKRDNDFHHAMDAAVVAATSRSVVKRISEFFAWREIHPFETKNGSYIDRDTGEVVSAKYIPQPWPSFRKELMARLSDNPITEITALNLPTYSDIDLKQLEPIFISRMPRCKVSGSGHKDTIRSCRGKDERGKILSSKRIKLEELTLGKLEKMVGKESDKVLYLALKERLETYGGSPKRAFTEPFYKPTRKKDKKGPLVRRVQIYDPPVSGGVFVNRGIADHGSMIRSDIFQRNGRYYISPVYANDVAKGTLPQRVIQANKAEADWPLIDNSYQFLFSLYPDELVKLVLNEAGEKVTYFGYYKGCDRAVGTLAVHIPRTNRLERKGIQRALSIEKYQVDPLGKVSLVRKEKRRGFSKRTHSKTCLSTGAAASTASEAG